MRRAGQTRKQRFQIALVMAGMSARQWCRDYYEVSHQHLSACLAEKREMNPDLKAAIDRFIDKYVGPDLGERFEQAQAKKRKGRS